LDEIGDSGRVVCAGFACVHVNRSRRDTQQSNNRCDAFWTEAWNDRVLEFRVWRDSRVHWCGPEGLGHHRADK
jgi:hypothetical protein